MTRINTVPVEELTTKHLVAEFRELPRIAAYIRKSNYSNEGAPDKYTLGKGHVKYFYNKLLFLLNRYDSLFFEGLRRGYQFKYRCDWIQALINSPTPPHFWQHWQPDEEAIELNRQRIQDRLNGKKD